MQKNTVHQKNQTHTTLTFLPLTWLAVICVLCGCIMNRNLSQDIAPMQKEDIITGKSWPAFTSWHKMLVLKMKKRSDWFKPSSRTVQGGRFFDRLRFAGVLPFWFCGFVMNKLQGWGFNNQFFTKKTLSNWTGFFLGGGCMFFLTPPPLPGVP